MARPRAATRLARRPPSCQVYAMAVGRLDTVEAALNAVLGDYLEQRGNALAIEMTLVHEATALRGKIAVFVHGLAATEACWSFVGDSTKSYGASLRDELAMTPVYVRYNSGRRISQNGLDLALRLEELVDAAGEIEEINLIGHSMGGLVIRSACHHAETLGMSWIRRVRRAVYLGSPHLGAPLEKAGHLVSLLLGAIDQPVVRLTRNVADLRSAGVKDLRKGTLYDGEPPVPLHPGMAHYLVAGTLTQDPERWFAKVFGDAMVGVKSATDPGRRAGLPANHIVVIAGAGHLDLAHSPAVLEKIRDWFGSPPANDGPGEVPSATDGPRGPLVVVDGRTRSLERVDAYRALVQDAVEHGATAIQQVHEELAAGPYDWIAMVPPLAGPAKVVRSAHLGAVRIAYGATRIVNRLVGAALREGLAWARRSRAEDDRAEDETDDRRRRGPPSE